MSTSRRSISQMSKGAFDKRSNNRVRVAMSTRNDKNDDRDTGTIPNRPLASICSMGANLKQIMAIKNATPASMVRLPIFVITSLSISLVTSLGITSARILDMDKFKIDVVARGFSSLRRQPSHSLRLRCHYHRSRSRTRVGM
ncbi:hypothetical protein G7Y89_g1237 [Cudoniella acicularis]|uniref:Uncharacterized protein n=1 Tax=Cudoniella acicularis TaxID=354080 RepID=A0A8H4RYJ6_9HELO|nr:hypothetical protein G7Y89_g1237 [Cudoniella acicularis]